MAEFLSLFFTPLSHRKTNWQNGLSENVERDQSPAFDYGILVLEFPAHSSLNDQNLFHSTIDAPSGVPGVSRVSKNSNDQTEVHSGKLER
jgi:hypothetical protein